MITKANHLAKLHGPNGLICKYDSHEQLWSLTVKLVQYVSIASRVTLYVTCDTRLSGARLMHVYSYEMGTYLKWFAIFFLQMNSSRVRMRIGRFLLCRWLESPVTGLKYFKLLALIMDQKQRREHNRVYFGIFTVNPLNMSMIHSYQ